MLKMHRNFWPSLSVAWYLRRRKKQKILFRLPMAIIIVSSVTCLLGSEDNFEIDYRCWELQVVWVCRDNCRCFVLFVCVKFGSFSFLPDLEEHNNLGTIELEKNKLFARLGERVRLSIWPWPDWEFQTGVYQWSKRRRFFSLENALLATKHYFLRNYLIKRCLILI